MSDLIREAGDPRLPPARRERASRSLLLKYGREYERGLRTALESDRAREALRGAVEQGIGGGTFALLVAIGDGEAAAALEARFAGAEEADRLLAVGVAADILSLDRPHLTDQGGPWADRLLACLRDPSRAVRLAALAALRGNVRGFPAQAEPLLDDPEPDVRRAAVDLAPGPCPAALVERLARLAESDADGSVRRAAIRKLGTSGSQAAEDALLRAARAGPLEERRDAMYALFNLWAELAGWRGLAPGSDPAKTVRAMREALGDPDPWVRAGAVDLLAYLKRDEAVAAIEEAMRGTDGPPRRSMLESLARMECRAASGFLSGVYGDERAPFGERVVAGEGLRRLGLPAPGTGRLRRHARWEKGGLGGSDHICVGAAPAVAAGGTGLAGALEPDGAAVDVALRIVEPRGDFSFDFSAQHARFVESGSGGPARVTQLGLGIGFLPYPSGERPGRIVPRLTMGLGFGFVDTSDDARDMLGFGMFARGSLGVAFARHWGVEAFVDGRFWLGGDDHGFQAGGSAAAGCGALYVF